MVSLIREQDNSVLSKDGFVKNAVFYKDLFAFYDAYTKLMKTDTADLPGYVYHKNRYILEGVCLFMKNYSSELGFESMHLTLDYLKVIYYTIASYSTDKNLPERTVFEEEFKLFSETANNMYVSALEEHKAQDLAYQKTKGEFDKLTSKFAAKLVWSKLFKAVSIVMLLASVISGMVPFAVYFLNNLTMTWACVLSAACIVVGFSISGVFKLLAKKYETYSGDSEYEVQQKKRSKDIYLSASRASYLKLSRIAGERYECNNNLFKELAAKRKVDGIDAVIAKASEYKLLSYNIKVDIATIFENQNNDEVQIIKTIQQMSASTTTNRELSDVYAEIVEKDWLYYSNEVRFEFIKKFALVANKTKEWSVVLNGKKIEPFGIKVKTLHDEKIVFLKDKNDLFVHMAYGDLLSTNLIKNSSVIKTKNIGSADKFRQSKMEYIEHFYSYEKTKNFNNLFSDTKFQDGVKASEELLSSTQQIPLMAQIELKLVENALGIANYASPTIKQIQSIIYEYETGEKFELQTETESERKTLKEITAIEEDMFDYAITYTFEDGSFVGYRLSNL